MLDSFLTEFAEIKTELGKEGEYNFFGKNFSFFSAEPILFYNNEKDVIVYANSMFSSEFNYSIEDLAEWKYSIYPLLNKEDQEPFKTAMKMLLEGDETTTFPDASYRLVNKGKKYSYYRVKVRKLLKSFYYIQLENSAKSAIPVLKNTTADELMNKAETILKFGFWLWDYPREKLYWTKGMYHLLEYDTNEEMDTSITPEFYDRHILKNESYLDFERRLKEGNIKESYRNKFQVKTNKNNLLTVFEHASIDLDKSGNIKRITGITRDITLQEESMKSLADYKAMMQENEAFLNYGTWESDETGENMLWTDGMYNIFGYNPEEKENLTINAGRYEQHLIPEDYARDLEANTKVLDANDYFHWDDEITDKQGVQKTLSTYGKVIRNHERSIQKIIGTTRDVTELRSYERMLENKIEELNRSNRELEEFAYVASHDLQEPLRKISTFSQRLQMKLGDKLGDDGNLYITRIVAACESMRNLIDNLLEFSRVGLNNAPPEQVNLTNTVHQVLEDLDLIISETSTTVEVGQLPELEAINSQMHQLFTNIISNSIKFRRHDVRLKVQVNAVKLGAKEKMQFELRADQQYHLITVQDNGIGFEQQYAGKIFQLFQRLEGKSEYPGTGIGLSICKKIIVNHKGIIFASGEPRNGALFSIILPSTQ